MKTLITLISVLISFSSFAYKAETIVSRSDTIWGFDFFKDGKMVFTERSGKLLTFDPKTKKVQEISGVPKVWAEGQGGLLDVRVHPSNGYIYFTYSEPKDSKVSATALSRAKIEGNKLTNYKKLFTADQVDDYGHFGSRIEFHKGHVYITTGDRHQRPKVQKLDSHLGKVIRLNEDGTVPKDNPYVGQKGALPEIYARGIRSPQGLMLRPGTSELWEAEMGPQGGDELNIIEPKKNYGWPEVTHGKEYSGDKITDVKSKKGVVDPIVYWVPSISPSALTFYTGDKMPEWKGNIFLANLAGQHLRRLELTGQKVTKQEELLKDLGYRWRNVRTGPDGYLWFSTDEGKIGRIIK